MKHRKHQHTPRQRTSRFALLGTGLVLLASIARADYTGSVLYRIDTNINPPPGFFVSFFNASGGEVVGNVVSSNLPRVFDDGLLWKDTGPPITLTPPGASSSSVAVTDGSQQVGASTFQSLHATLWSGSSASAIDLHPANLNGILYSAAGGLCPSQQVGFGQFVGGPSPGGTMPHALLWSGSAASAVDLHPASVANVVGSTATATDGVHQVGQVWYGQYLSGQFAGDIIHAAVWSGTADTMVDLNPKNNAIGSVQFFKTEAVAVSGNEEVGQGQVVGTSDEEPLLWHGTAASAVDLRPSGTPFGSTFFKVNATNGRQEVGFSFIGETRAMVWSGTAASAVDLQPFLPSSLGESQAYSIDASGNIYGIASDVAGDIYAVEWQATVAPEPRADFILVVSLALAPFCRKRRTLMFK